MKLSIDLKPFTSNYPSSKSIPKNLIKTEYRKKFHPTKKKKSFKEQFANEQHPHKVKHITYQYGNIEDKEAVMFFRDNKPVRLTYVENQDPYIFNLLSNTPPRTFFPPNSVPSNIARGLRENALKWVVDKFLASIQYMCFDEPILDGVNPDSFALPETQVHEILNLDHHSSQIEEINGNKLANVEIKNALFIEIKAYHGSTIVGEKEVLQAFNYASKGGKALLITTGRLGTYDSFKILNENLGENEENLQSHYDESLYKKFVSVVKKKFRKLIRKIDLNLSQDSYDTRGIYISSSSKLDKIYKYTIDWPSKISFDLLETPNAIMTFIQSGSGLGIVVPAAFEKLLRKRDLKIAADLFSRILKTYIEELMINPPLLYPLDNSTFPKI